MTKAAIEERYFISIGQVYPHSEKMVCIACYVIHVKSYFVYFLQILSFFPISQHSINFSWNFLLFSSPIVFIWMTEFGTLR